MEYIHVSMYKNTFDVKRWIRFSGHNFSHYCFLYFVLFFCILAESLCPSFDQLCLQKVPSFLVSHVKLLCLGFITFPPHWVCRSPATSSPVFSSPSQRRTSRRQPARRRRASLWVTTCTSNHPKVCPILHVSLTNLSNVYFKIQYRKGLFLLVHSHLPSTTVWVLHVATEHVYNWA